MFIRQVILCWCLVIAVFFSFSFEHHTTQLLWDKCENAKLEENRIKESYSVIQSERELKLILFNVRIIFKSFKPITELSSCTTLQIIVSMTNYSSEAFLFQTFNNPKNDVPIIISPVWLQSTSQQPLFSIWDIVDWTLSLVVTNQYTSRNTAPYLHQRD